MRRGFVTLVLMAGLLMGTSPANAASITFRSQDVTLGVDQSFDVDILVEGLDESVVSFLFNFTFDPTVLALQGIAEGSFLSAFGPTFFDPTPLSTTVPPDFQTVTNVLFEGSTIGSSGILATLTFVPLAAGLGQLTLLEAGLGEFAAARTAFVPLVGDVALEPDLPPGTINVLAPPQPVPEPSTLALLGIGLAALARKRLRRKSQPGA